MPAQRPRASFEPIPPSFNLKALVESTPNFSYVDRISCEMIEQQGLQAFEKLVLLHVIIGGKPLVIDGYEDKLDPWTFTPQWLFDNCGEKQESARNLTAQENLPLTISHYLKNMGMLTDQFFNKPDAYRERKRQRVYLKDVDCPSVWQEKLRDHIPSSLYYLNESTGEVGGPGAALDPGSRRLGKGVGRAGDLMSSLPAEMRAENLMCYIGHEGTYTPAHREMCASLGQNIMVEASNTVSVDGRPEKPGSSIWFMTESKDRHTVSEYWLSVLGHDIEVENHFAQIVAWKKAPFSVYVVEQRPGDFILIPPLAPHQVWNCGTRTMKVAWNRTTVETLEMALNEALPRSRIVCRDEQYKNKAIIYYTLQKYSSLLTLTQNQARKRAPADAQQLLYSSKVKQLVKDFRRLFNLYRQVLLSEMFSPDERDNPKSIEYLPFDGNVTCAYCRGNIFNRFLTCPSCKNLLGHTLDDAEGDPYDVCMDCYAMGRSCACISNLKWVEQFRWKELAAKYEGWRKLIISLDGGQILEKTPLPLVEEKKRYQKRTLAEVCKDQLKRRPWKDPKKNTSEPAPDEEEEEEEIVVDDNGMVRKMKKKRSKNWLKNNAPCHVCCHRHPNWKMACCTKCERMWCYGTLFRGWDKMPTDIMTDLDWTCPHCLGICFAGACKREGRMQVYEPKGTLLGHDTKKVADARSVEVLVDFSISNLNWLKDDNPQNALETRRIKRAGAEAQKAKDQGLPVDSGDESGIEESQVELEYSPTIDHAIDPALGGSGASPSVVGNDAYLLAERLHQANSSWPVAATTAAPALANDGAPDGYIAASYGGFVPPTANMYPMPGEQGSYNYPGQARTESIDAPNAGDDLGELSPAGHKRTREESDDIGAEDFGLKFSRFKKPRLTAAGFRSSDLADAEVGLSKAKNEAQRQFEREKDRKALERAKSEGRFIRLQAAMKGKKKIVKLPITGSRLAQMLARQAVKASQTTNDCTEAESAAADDVAQEEPEDDEVVILKSDIAPPKKKPDPKEYHQQRQRDGLVVSSITRKALIPVEQDYSYGSHSRTERGQKQRANEVRTDASNGRKQPSKRNVEYEEVDIGSDDDPEDSSLFALSEGASASRTEKRALPGYLQDRYAGENLPEELPPEQPKRRVPKLHPVRDPTSEKVPVPVNNNHGSHLSGHAANESNGAGHQTLNKGGVSADATLDSHQLHPKSSTTSFASKPETRTPAAASQSNAYQKQQLEQDRLAKVKALGSSGGGGQGNTFNVATKAERGPTIVSMADALVDESDNDDGVDEVPAKRSSLQGQHF